MIVAGREINISSNVIRQSITLVVVLILCSVGVLAFTASIRLFKVFAEVKLERVDAPKLVILAEAVVVLLAR